MTVCFDVKRARSDGHRFRAELLPRSRGKEVMTMKRTRIVRFFGFALIAVLFLVQTQCMMIAGKAAVAGGKEAYERVKGDDSDKDK
jgi:hypothetical protein